jgi:hypothetical protein
VGSVSVAGAPGSAAAFFGVGHWPGADAAVDFADAITYIVTRPRRRVNEMLICPTAP